MCPSLPHALSFFLCCAVPCRAVPCSPPPVPLVGAGPFKFDFEEQDLDEAAVRKLVWEEMSHFAK